MADAMKKGYEDVKQMLSTYVPPSAAPTTKTQYDEMRELFPLELEREPMRGDKTQNELMGNLVGIKEPRTRRKLRSMGAPIREANPLRGEAGETKRVERRAKKEKGRNKGAILQDAIMGKDVPKLVARYPTHFEENSNKQDLFDLDNMLHTLDSLSERGEFETMSDLLDSVPKEVRIDRAARYAEALETTPWLVNRHLMLQGGDDNLDTVDEFGVPHDFPFTREIGYHLDQTYMQRLEDTQGLTGTDSFRIPTPRHHESFPYFRRDMSGKYILPLEGLSTSGDDKERPKHLAASLFDDMPRPIWMETIGGSEKPSSEFVEVHPGQEGQEWPHWSEFNQSQEMDGGIDDDVWRDESLGFDETGRGEIVRRKTDPNNPLYRATEARGEPLMPLPRKLTLMPDEEKFEAEFGEHGKGVFTGLPFNVGTGFTTGEPMEIAWQLLKDMKDIDGPLRRFYNLEQDQKNLQTREDAHVAALTPQIDETPVPETPMVDMPDGFFGNHAHERLTDQDRVVDEQEEEEVRSRITEAMQPFVDERGNFKLGAPKQIAIRTHLLDEHRQPDEAMSLSNGNSIVGIVRPHRKNKLKPDLHTVMLRRSELSHQPQPFTTDALRVDAVVNNHGVPKKRFKRMVRDHRRTLRRAEPMDIAFRLLKAYEDEHLQSYLDGDMDEMGMFGNSFDKNRFPFLHINANNPFVHDNDDAVNELMSSEEGYEALEPALRDYENQLKALHDHTVLSASPQGSPPQLANAIDGLVRDYRDQSGFKDMTHEEVMQIAMTMYMSTLKALKMKNAQLSFDPSMMGDLKSKPMDIAFRLLKERKSPEAFANKKKYDSEYQKTPKRVKYREQLNAERRKRGIYGKGGKDVSHTQGGKLTLESPHLNRARHFKNRGTLRRVK